MSGEISVNITALEECEEQMSYLYRKLNNRQFKVEFTNGSGLMSDELLKVAEEVKELSVALTESVEKTRVALNFIKTSFIGADAAATLAIEGLGDGDK